MDIDQQRTRMRGKASYSLFDSIATRSGIWIREKTKILRNVVGGGRVLMINGDVRMDNALISGGRIRWRLGLC